MKFTWFLFYCIPFLSSVDFCTFAWFDGLIHNSFIGETRAATCQPQVITECQPQVTLECQPQVTPQCTPLQQNLLPATVPGLTSVTFSNVTEWFLNESQSNINGRSGSNACVFIALSMGKVLKGTDFEWPVGDSISRS